MCSPTERDIQALNAASVVSDALGEQGTGFVIQNQIPVLLVESSIPPDTFEADSGSARIGVREFYSDARGTSGTFSRLSERVRDAGARADAEDATVHVLWDERRVRRVYRRLESRAFGEAGSLG